MSYQMYTTEAIVCGSFASNTADKSYLLFTRSAGMVYATARSVREERSRQRYALQDFSHITVSLVRGKSGWRIGSVDCKNNLFMTASTRAARGSVVKLCKLLRRYVRGEEAYPGLYDEFITALTFMTTFEKSSRGLVEDIITARILYLLGYIASSVDLDTVLNEPLVTLNVDTIEKTSRLITASLANAQSASHL